MQSQILKRFPTPARRDQLELLDDPARVSADLPANLADIRRLNRWFGGTPLVRRYVSSLLPADGTARILDVATGSADIPLSLHVWGRRRGLRLDIHALDLHDAVLAEARRVIGEAPIRLHRGDARALCFDDRSFDIVTCSLALHHFEPSEAVRVLEEMWRVARRAVLAVDLTRGYAGHLGAWLATRTIARNRLTRHDGPLSVLRSYTPAEMADLAGRAGIHDAVVRRHAFFRQALAARKDTTRGH